MGKGMILVGLAMVLTGCDEVPPPAGEIPPPEMPAAETVQQPVESPSAPVTNQLAAEIFVKLYPDEPDSPAGRALLKENGVTPQALDKWWQAMLADDDRAELLGEIITTLSPEQGKAFTELRRR